MVAKTAQTRKKTSTASIVTALAGSIVLLITGAPSYSPCRPRPLREESRAGTDGRSRRRTRRRVAAARRSPEPV